jgi:hypothetical protein
MRTPKTTPLMLTRADRPEHTPEAEPVTVETDADVVRLTLDDGVTLDFDRRELAAAVAA